jgi:TPP-dependent pyruvate/acetoin dehydrogenase alpha subunit
VGQETRGERACALTFFGDGATSEGAFHEGANFAA